ncbi:MAG: prephenate dehydrogenase [Candidatus Caldarchaeum sp.]
MAGFQAAVVGAGPMGLWMAEHLASRGHAVKIYDINPAKTRRAVQRFTPAKSLDDAVSNASTVVVAVGSKNAGKIIREIVSRHSGKTIVDISSVKTPVLRSVKRLPKNRGLIVLTHPLFGPGARKLADKTVVVTTFRRPVEEAAEARKIFKPCKVVLMTPEEHDRVMAYAMAVPRILMLSLLECWRRKKVDVLTTSQRAFMLAASTMFSEKPNVINEIITSNPYTAKALSDVKKLMKKMEGRGSAEILKTYRRLAAERRKLAKHYERVYSLLERIA